MAMSISNGKRPFEDVEPILRALESLDLNNNTPIYFRSVRTAAGTAEQDVETMRWLDSKHDTMLLGSPPGLREP